MERRDRPSLRAAAVAAVLAAAAAAYAPSLPGSFTLDDRSAVADRSDLGDPAALLAAVPRSLVGRGRALTDLSFAAGRALHGTSATAYRVENVLLHLLVALVLLALGGELVRRAGVDRPWLPVAAVALWALHPLGSEAVAYVCQRAEALSAGLAAAGVLVALRADRARRPWLARGFAAALVLASLGAKGVGVVAFAAVALVLVALPRGGAPGWRAAGREIAPLLAPALAFGAGLLRHAAGKQDVGFSIVDLPPGHAWLSQGRVLATYLRLALWPAGQSPDHGLPASTTLDGPALAGWVVVVAFAGLCLAALARRRDPSVRLAGLGGLWFLLWLAPTSALPLADLLAEHRAYLPLFGLALAAAAVGDVAVRRLARSRRAAVGGAVALAFLASGALGGLLVRRAALWGDPVALWSDAVRVAPGFFRPYANLAKSLRERGRSGEASIAWRLAVERWPAPRLEAALRYVGSLRELAATGEGAEAARLLAGLPERVLPAPSLYVAVGLLWIDLGNAPTAELLLSQAAVINAYDPDVLGALGLAYAAQDRVGEAVTVTAMALERSGASHLRLQLAELHRRAGRPAEACRLLTARNGPELEAAARTFGCR